MPKLDGILGRSLLVALGVTLAGGLLLFGVLAASDALFVRDSAQNVDEQLLARYRVVATGPQELATAERGASRTVAGEMLVWEMNPAGGVAFTPGAPWDLPAGYRQLSGFATVRMDGHPMRLYGGPLEGGDRVVLGRSLESVDSGRQGVTQSQLIVFPVALVAVFLGALAVARWVATPLDRARQEQLRFTAEASHELRTPLAVLQGEVSLALSRERDAGEYRAALQRVSGEADRLARLVEDLLWLARFEAQPGTPPAEAVRLDGAAAEAVRRFEVVASRRRLDLSLTTEGQPEVLAPPPWIDRLLGVLLANARTYTPAGGRVAVHVDGGAGRARLIVDDSGPGIPAAERSRVFSRFHRGTTAGDGAGLGLAIADAVVRSLRGTWEVTTSPLGGARLAVTWGDGGSGLRRP